MNFIEYYQNIPLQINPTAFSVGSFSVKWYSLAYFIGFIVVWFILEWRIKRNEIQGFKMNSDFLQDFLLFSFIAAIIGGRLGYVLLYNYSYYANDTVKIIWPFENGHFVGIYGMSFYGALIAVIAFAFIFAKRKKIDFFRFADFITVAVPAGYFFGRIGNFLNGELYGRITSRSIGMHFAADSYNLRHPSQLYEAILEGLFLFVFLWIYRKKTTQKGQLFCFFILGYSTVRFVLEFLRDPQGEIILNITKGQFYSIIFMVLSILMIFKLRTSLPKK